MVRDWLLSVDAAAVRRYLAGDLLVVVGFLAVGEYHHGVNPMTNPGLFADTAVPFLVGWALASPLLGAYGRRAASAPVPAAATAVVAWLGADAVGQLLRDTRWFHGDADLVFFLVLAAGGGVLLVGWRVLRSLAAAT